MQKAAARLQYPRRLLRSDRTRDNQPTDHASQRADRLLFAALQTPTAREQTADPIEPLANLSTEIPLHRSACSCDIRAQRCHRASPLGVRRMVRAQVGVDEGMQLRALPYGGKPPQDFKSTISIGYMTRIAA